MTNHTRTALAGALLALVACGGGGGAGGTGNTGGTTPTALALGSSGFPGLDWGDAMAAVKADYPAAEKRDDGLELRAPHGGQDAEISFMFSGDSLVAIGVSYTEKFESMPVCGETFQQVRAELDKTLGGSGEDTLQSYWSTESASVTLSCDPDGDEGTTASLSLSYSLPEPDEM